MGITRRLHMLFFITTALLIGVLSSPVRAVAEPSITPYNNVNREYWFDFFGYGTTAATEMRIKEDTSPFYINVTDDTLTNNLTNGNAVDFYTEGRGNGSSAWSNQTVGGRAAYRGKGRFLIRSNVFEVFNNNYRNLVQGRITAMQVAGNGSGQLHGWWSVDSTGDWTKLN